MVVSIVIVVPVSGGIVVGSVSNDWFVLSSAPSKTHSEVPAHSNWP